MIKFTVVITSYNHGQYISQAIKSVKKQNFDGVETIVVDDGSTDDTASVVSSFKQVKYIYQENKGPNAARNVGFRASEGDFIIFLDADDWLLPNALETINRQLDDNPKAVMIGGHVKVWETPLGYEYGDPYTPQFERDPYLSLLQRNVVEMHASVAYERTVLTKTGGFDENLKAAEDYDFLLRVARDFPNRISTHSAPVAAYRQHDSNMSKDAALMLKAVMNVLDRHREGVAKSPTHVRALNRGIQHHKDYYGRFLMKQLFKGPLRNKSEKRHFWSDARVAARYIPVWLLKEIPLRITRPTRHWLSAYAPKSVRRLLRKD